MPFGGYLLILPDLGSVVCPAFFGVDAGVDWLSDGLFDLDLLDFDLDLEFELESPIPVELAYNAEFLAALQPSSIACRHSDRKSSSIISVTASSFIKYFSCLTTAQAGNSGSNALRSIELAMKGEKAVFLLIRLASEMISRKATI